MRVGVGGGGPCEQVLCDGVGELGVQGGGEGGEQLREDGIHRAFTRHRL